MERLRTIWKAWRMAEPGKVKFSRASARNDRGRIAKIREDKEWRHLMEVEQYDTAATERKSTVKTSVKDKKKKDGDKE